MLFSVLIANYNNSGFLRESLDSVLEQTYTNWEIILIDDGSTDEFERVIADYQDNAKIKIFRNLQNEGCAVTKFRCASLASGELVAFLDPDDTLTPDALEIMVGAHTRYPSCSIINSTHFVCDDTLKPERVSLKPKSLPPETPYLLLGDGSIHAFASFKKSAYDRTAGLTPNRKYDKAIDQELYYILEEEGDVHFINASLYYYRIHSGSISNWGQESFAMLQHYMIIEEACKRRIKKLKNSDSEVAGVWRRRYQTHYYKTAILSTFRRKQWGLFASNVILYPFNGGIGHMHSYLRKLRKEGSAVLRRSFAESYQH